MDRRLVVHDFNADVEFLFLAAGGRSHSQQNRPVHDVPPYCVRDGISSARVAAR